jgi:hypothetical protein
MNIPYFDEEAFKKSYDEAIRVVMRQAMRIFLKKVLSIVPSYSGMARGSLIPLGAYLHVAVPTPVEAGVKSRVSEGMALAKTKFLEAQGMKYAFRMGTGVKHFNINDQIDVSSYGFHFRNPVPWHSFKQGQELANQYVKEQLPKRLPKISKFIKYKSIVRHTPKLG